MQEIQCIRLLRKQNKIIPYTSAAMVLCTTYTAACHQAIVDFRGVLMLSIFICSKETTIIYHTFFCYLNIAGSNEKDRSSILIIIIFITMITTTSKDILFNKGNCRIWNVTFMLMRPVIIWVLQCRNSHFCHIHLHCVYFLRDSAFFQPAIVKKNIPYNKWKINDLL